MRVIYKYPLEITAEQVINIPMLYFYDRVARCNEQVLHVDVQDVIRPCLWCMVDTENQTYPMKVVTKMTGEEIREDEKDKLKYVGSYLIGGGDFVGHVFVCYE